MRSPTLAIILTLTMITQVGCYSTLRVNLNELQKVQESDGAEFKSIKTEDGQEISITESSRLGLVLKSGEAYQISPFNFTLNQRQLVSPDEDLILNRSQIETGTLKIIDPQNTTFLISGGFLTLAALAAIAIVLTPDCTGKFCNVQ